MLNLGLISVESVVIMRWFNLFDFYNSNLKLWKLQLWQLQKFNKFEIMKIANENLKLRKFYGFEIAKIAKISCKIGILKKLDHFIEIAEIIEFCIKIR